jgi:HK97 family phage major capsid protein
MNETLKIQERLKEVAADLLALAEQQEPWTAEQEATIEALESEQAQLTTRLDELRKDQKKADLKAQADGILNYAKGSGRLTSAGAPGIRNIRLAVADDPKRGFKSFGHFAALCMDHHANPRDNEMLMQVAAGTGMTQAVSADGGVLVPPAFSKAVWDEVLVQSNSMLPYCFQMPVDPGTESITIPAIAESSRANGSRYGGIQGYWKDELTELTGTKVTARQVKLTPHELYVFAYISDKLLRNSPGTASALLERAAASEIAF